MSERKTRVHRAGGSSDKACTVEVFLDDGKILFDLTHEELDALGFRLSKISKALQRDEALEEALDEGDSS